MGGGGGEIDRLIDFKELAHRILRLASLKFSGQTGKQETQGEVCCSLESEGNLEAEFLLPLETLVFFLKTFN